MQHTDTLGRVECCEQSRAALTKGDLLVATGCNDLSRGVLLVKANGGKPVVVGVGY